MPPPIGRIGFNEDWLKGGSRSEDEFSTEGSQLPEDLRDWIPEPELAYLVDSAVQEARRGEAPHKPTRTWDLLLGIITYSYATGTYLSEEIEDLLERSPGLDQMHSLLFREALASVVLRSFRRTNRSTIERCLAHVLRSAFRHGHSERSTAVSDRSSRIEFLDFEREATARLAHAIQSDSWAMDV